MNIPSLIQTLIERLQGRESLEAEFKAARGGLPISLWETVSSFANTGGGWIVLGISQEANTLRVEGINNPHSMLQNFSDLIHNPQKISHNVCGVTDASIEVLDGKSILVIRVPAAPRKARPVYINNNPYQGTFVRRNEGDYHCSKSEVDRMMREASDVSADANVLRQYDLSDIDVESLARYRRLYQTLHPGALQNSFTDYDFLKSINGIRRDREQGFESITVAGLLLAGKPEAIRDWRTRHLIDFRIQNTEGELESRWDDRVAWEGNLFGAFDAIYPRLIQGQPSPFRLEGAVRIDEGFMQVVLREAFVNLLVHADYSESQPSLIIRDPGGYFFRNPGASRVSDLDLLTGDRSDPRNPELVRMFRLIGLAEEAGTGIPKIVANWRKLGFRLPDIDTGTERYEFALDLRHAHLIGEGDRAWLLTIGSDWSEAEQLALVRARHDSVIDNPTLRRLTGQHPADTTRILGTLRDRGFLQMIGVGRGAHYQLSATIGGANLSSGNTVSNSGGSVLNSGGSVLNSGGSVLNSGGFDSELLALSQVARERSHLASDVLDNLVVQLCSKKALSLQDLSELLKRNKDYLLGILRRLVEIGEIRFLYPDHPNHPKQKYLSNRERPD